MALVTVIMDMITAMAMGIVTALAMEVRRMKVGTITTKEDHFGMGMNWKSDSIG